MSWIAAPLYAVSAAVFTAALLAFAGDGLSSTVAWVALVTGALVGGLAVWRERRRVFASRALNLWDHAALLAFALFALRAFLWLVFRTEDHVAVLSPNNLGDFSLHLTYVRFFAAGAPFWPENPIFSGAPLTYPLGMDLFNALLALIGVDELRGFIWVGLLGSACAAGALWKWGGAFAVAGFLFAGGLFGFEFFETGELLDYQSEAAWKSLPLALFVTQRGLLFALPAGLLLLASWRARFFETPRSALLPALGEVLLYAAMPIFHLHTFLFLSLIAAVWFVALPAARKHLAVVVGAALLPATIEVWGITGGFTGVSMLGWKPGWMQEETNFLMFWLMNFGILPILTGALVFTVFKHRRREAALLVAPALVIFLACCFVKFAPWEWDNTKLMLWSYLTILPPLWSELLARWPTWARAVACVLLFFSGAVSLCGGLGGRHTGYPIAQRSERDAVGAAVRAIPITARFVGHPTYNHPLLLNGRIFALGYTGHAWSHGLDWQPRLEAVELILRGEVGWREAVTRLGVRYLFWGREEREHYPESSQPWRDTTALVAEGEWGAIYDLKSPVAPPAR